MREFFACFGFSICIDHRLWRVADRFACRKMRIYSRIIGIVDRVVIARLSYSN